MDYFIKSRKITFEDLFNEEELDDNSVQSDKEENLVSDLDLEETWLFSSLFFSFRGSAI